MNYLDLFSGCGGFRRGLEETGFTFEWEGYSEIDKYAKQVYEKHYPESEDLGDVRTIRTDKLPKINLITFGFPCQDLSIAGKRGGLGASRSGLFFEAMRIIRDAKPDYFIFENVKGLFSSRGGLDWLNILREVADSGYDGQWQLLNTRWFLPQNRERIYFVGYPRERSRPQIFPIGEGNREYKGRPRLVANALDANYFKGPSNGFGGKARTLVQRHPLKFIERNQKNIEGDYAFTLDGANTGGVKITEATKKGYAIAEEGDAINLQQPDSKTRRGRVRKGEANTLDTGQQQYTIQSGIRRLTPTECERLQGFPDGWTEGQSDTQRYKMLGNAVSVPVVKAVMERLKIGGLNEIR